jgi:hypothetical protein
VTVVDLQSLHDTMDSLQRRQKAVTHSLDRQFTYFRDLDESVRSDHQAVIDLSSAITDFAIKTKESFQEVANKLELNNKLPSFINADTAVRIRTVTARNQSRPNTGSTSICTYTACTSELTPTPSVPLHSGQCDYGTARTFRVSRGAPPRLT